MDLTVVGLGYVGLVSAAGLATRGHRVRGTDADPARIGQLRDGTVPFFEPHLAETVERARLDGSLVFDPDPAHAVAGADVVLVAVGTHDQAGGWQTRTIADCLSAIVPRLSDGAVLVVRSTLPPDFVGPLRTLVRALRAASGRGPIPLLLNPEFTREGTAVADFLAPDRIVVGAVDDPAGDGMDRVRSMYAGFDAPILAMSGPDACLAKLGSNLFLATKISFANELARLCDRYGAQVDQVVRAMAPDKRIGGGFLRPGVGFGGSCLPHQVTMTVRAFTETGETLPLLGAVEAVNLGQRERCVGLLEHLVGNLAGRRIALLGLTFKPNTDDLRDAPSIPIALRLLELGAEVVAYDPMPRARERAAEAAPGLSVVDSALAALRGADGAALVTEWREVIDLDWRFAAAIMRGAAVVDGRNALDPAVIRAAGLAYAGFGRAGSMDFESDAGVDAAVETAVAAFAVEPFESMPAPIAVPDPRLAQRIQLVGPNIVFAGADNGSSRTNGNGQATHHGR